MKKLIVTGIAVAGLAVGAFGQGELQLQNESLTSSIDDGTAGTLYAFGSPLTIQVYYLGTGADPAIWNGPGGSTTSASAAYAALTGLSGAKLEATQAGTVNSLAWGDGYFNFGVVNLNDAPAPATAVTWTIGLVGFNGSDWAHSTKGGVVTFTMTGSTTAAIPVTMDGWDALPVQHDLVMSPVPEPATFALAGLGAAAMLIFRRRK